MLKRFFASSLLVSSGLVGGCIGLIPFAQAQTYAVTNTNDFGAGSLRQAIFDAEGYATANAGSTPTINFSGSGVGTITLASPLPLIYTNINIQGSTGVAIDGNNQYRGFFVLWPRDDGQRRASGRNGEHLQYRYPERAGTGRRRRKRPKWRRRGARSRWRVICRPKRERQHQQCELRQCNRPRRSGRRADRYLRGRWRWPRRRWGLARP